MLSENQEHFEGLIEYAKFMLDEREDNEEALRVLLKCLVRNQRLSCFANVIHVQPP